MIVLPRAEIDHLAGVLHRLPGIDGSAARRALLRLVWPDGGKTDFIPDTAIESGWRGIIKHLSEPPFRHAIANLQFLLRGIGQVLQLGEFTDLLNDAISRLDQLSNERSCTMFVARLGIDIDDADTTSIALINEVFVSPEQYKKAEEILEREHMLFLFGDPHMGKTFCAIHFLWEHFRDRGREPYWRRAPLSSGNADLNLDSLIIDGASIYVEDPFGRTAPIDNADDMLRGLRRLLLNVKNQDVRIIVTSRTAVLSAIIADRLKEYVVTLSQELLLEKSYEEKALTQIAINYLNIYRPKWTNNADLPSFAKRIAAELRAPHNIQEFVSATRQAPDAESAMARLEAFHDIVHEFVVVFKKLDEWVITALLVVVAASDQNVPHDSLIKLYERLHPNRMPYRTFDAALRTVHDYVVIAPSITGDLQPVPRHPSIEEAVENLCRQEEFLMEANWLIVETCHEETDFFFDRMAIRLLVTYADRWAEQSDRLYLLNSYFDSNELEIREASRRTVLNRFEELREEAADIIVDVAMKSWGDRFLMQFLLRSNALSEACYERLAIDLCKSKDSQTRYFLAELLGRGLRAQVLEIIGQRLLEDADWLVRRLAILRCAEYFSNNPQQEREIKRAVNSLPFRHRHWLQTTVKDLAAHERIEGVLGLSGEENRDRVVTRAIGDPDLDNDNEKRMDSCKTDLYAQLRALGDSATLRT